MKEGPNISQIAALIGDPARANMIMALMSGMALTATELSREAGITLSTASVHLSKLVDGGLLQGVKQGRHRYFRIANPDVADAVEALVTIATRAGHLRTRPGPRDQDMRVARSCYDHLAGRYAVGLFDHWNKAGLLMWQDDKLQLTEAGRGFVTMRGLDIAKLSSGKRPVCRGCIDWSERQYHLGGALGAAVLDHILAAGWASRSGGKRTVAFSAQGERHFIKWYSGSG